MGYLYDEPCLPEVQSPVGGQEGEAGDGGVPGEQQQVRGLQSGLGVPGSGTEVLCPGPGQDPTQRLHIQVCIEQGLCSKDRPGRHSILSMLGIILDKSVAET